MLDKIKNIKLYKLDENESIKLMDEISKQDDNDIKICLNYIIDNNIELDGEGLSLFYTILNKNDKIRNILENLLEIELDKMKIEEDGYCKDCKNYKDGVYNIDCDTCEHLDDKIKNKLNEL